MKKRYIFLCILAVFIIVIGIVVWINLDNIKAIYRAMQYNTEEIEIQIEENEKKNTEILEKYSKSEINPLSDEDAEKLNSGEISEEEAVDIILGRKESSNTVSDEEASDPKPQESGKPVEQEKTVQQEENTISPEDDERLGELIAKIYVLKEKYNKQIEEAYLTSMRRFYRQPVEQQTDDKKYEMGLTLMKNLLDLQDKCDVEMEVIFTEMTEILKRNNMSSELVDEIRKAYKEEKELKKAYFVNKYTE